MKKISKKFRNLNTKIFSGYFTSRHSLGLMIFTVGFLFLAYSTKYFTSFEKVIILLLGLVGLALVFFTVIEYLSKVYILLQENGFVGKREFIFSISTFVGFIVPVFFGNHVVLGIIKILSSFSYSGTFLCEIRCSLIRYYYNYNIFDFISTFNSIVLVLIILVFFFGVVRKD